MGDKIIVTPEEIRCLGNIIIPKPISDYRCYKTDLSENTDETEGIIAPIYKMEYNPLVVEIGNVQLSSNINQVYTDSNIIFSAEVTSIDGDVANGQTVTFYQGETIIGTAVTNSNGIATFNHSWEGDGEYTLSCVCSGVTSNSTVVTIIPKLVPVLTIAASDWVMYKRNTNLPVTISLTDDGEAFANQSVTVYANNSIVTTASTDSNGEISTNIPINARENITVKAVYDGNSSHASVETTNTTYVGAIVFLTQIEGA